MERPTVSKALCNYSQNPGARITEKGWSEQQGRFQSDKGGWILGKTYAREGLRYWEGVPKRNWPVARL